MTKDEALKMCLEYIETDAHERKYVRHAIKEALAQPEQEPVAWMTHSNDLTPLFHKTRAGALNWQTQPKPLYTTPPQRKPLTDEDVNKLVDDEDWYNDPHKFARIVETKIKQRNT